MHFRWPWWSSTGPWSHTHPFLPYPSLLLFCFIGSSDPYLISFFILLASSQYFIFNASFVAAVLLIGVIPRTSWPFVNGTTVLVSAHRETVLQGMHLLCKKACCIWHRSSKKALCTEKLCIYIYSDARERQNEKRLACRIHRTYQIFQTFLPHRLSIVTCSFVICGRVRPPIPL